MKLLRTCILIALSSFLLFIFNSCGSFIGGDVNTLLEIAEISKLPAQEDYPEDDAVKLFESHETFVDYQGDYEVTEIVHNAILLFKNIEGYSNISIDLSKYEDLLDLEARTIRPDGTIIYLNDDDFHKSIGETSGSVLVDDDRSIKFAFPKVEKGAIIEWKYRIRSSWVFNSKMWVIQNTIPIIKNEYILRVSKDLVRLSREYGYDLNWNAKPYNYRFSAKPQVQNKQGKFTYTSWVIRDIPAFEFESKMPPIFDYITYIRFAPVRWQKSWNVISEDYFHKYYKSKCNITSKIEKLAEELVQGCGNEDDKIRKIFDYVKKIRYVAIELGDGGYSPYEPEEVLENQYGDCKDKSTLLIALLKSIDIEAKPVLVKTKNAGGIDIKFPMMNFNHMIVKVIKNDKSEYWLDPTIEFANPGYISSSLSDIYVLVINDDGTSSIEQIPNTDFMDNIDETIVNVNVLSDTEVKYTIKFKSNGEGNINNRYIFKDKTDKEEKEFFKNMLKTEFTDINITNIFHDEVDGPEDEFSFGFEFTSNNAIQKVGDLYILNYNPLPGSDYTGWFKYDKRNYPIYFKNTFMDVNEINISINSKDLRFKALPENAELIKENVVYKIDFLKGDDKSAKIMEMYSVRSNHLSQSFYEDYKKFYTDKSTKSTEKILLEKSL